jgi:ABC-type transport system involved in multi-copper enzyme maturation permease subunit
VLFGGEWRRNVRSARVVVLLLLFAMFTLLALLMVGAAANAVDRQITQQLSAGASPEAAARAMAQMRQGAIGFLFSNDPEAVAALSQIPLVILVVFRLTLIFLPLYIALMGFDQLSGEIGPRSIRYLLVRAGRSSILFGKFLGQAAVLVSLVLLIDAGIFAYARVTNPDFGVGLAALTLVKLWTAATLFSLAYLALTTLCSALFRTPAVSLVFNVIVLFAFWLMDVLGQRASLVAQLAGGEGGRSALSYLGYFSPSHYATGLLHPAFSRFALSGAAYAGFTLVFLLAAYAILRERDL